MTKVEIANAALNFLGAGRITTLDDQGSPESRNVSSMFQSAAEHVLKSAEWPDIVRSEKLTLYGDDRSKIKPWEYAYAVPNGCLIPLSMSNADSAYKPIENMPVPGNPGAAAPVWVKEGNTIYTDVAGAVLRFTFYPDDMNILSTYIADAISYELAHRVSNIIGRDPKTKAMLFEQARLALKSARDSVGREGAGVRTTSQKWDSRA